MNGEAGERPLRVLFVNENVGGHATVHHNLAKVYAGRDDIDAQFLHVPAPKLGRRLVGTRLPGLAGLDLDFQPLRAQLAAAAWVRTRLRRMADESPGFDAMHVYTQNAGLLSVALMRRIPTVVTLDTTNTLNALRLPYRHPTRFTPLTRAATVPFEKRVYRAARRIVANSDWAAASLRDDYGVGPDQLSTVPFGIVAPPFEEGPAPGTTGGRPRLVFVGRQLERKGGARLLRLYREHLAARAELLLVTGEPVPPTPGVTVIDDLRPGEDRLWHLLRGSAVFVFPSQIDQAPNAVLEAMAAGLPCVVLASGAVPEMVEHGRSGYVLPLDASDETLLDAMVALIEDPAMRVTMGSAARQRFVARYDMHDAADTLLGLLEQAAAQGGSIGRAPAPKDHGRSR